MQPTQNNQPKTYGQEERMPQYSVAHKEAPIDRMKKTVVIVFSIAVVVLIGGVLFILLGGLGDQTIPIDTPQTGGVPTDVSPVDPYPNDKDRDGVSDTREAELGTSDFEFDTDGDALSDADEIELWGTDPTNEDTDGDGFWDGVEVLNGYNPNGDGELVVPAERETSRQS